jgi:hypothetical protein
MLDTSHAVRAALSSETRFDEVRRRIGVVLGPLLFVIVLLLPFPATLARGPSAGGHHGARHHLLDHRGGAAGGHGASWTGAGDVMMGVAPVGAAFAPMANPLIFLFHWQLHPRSGAVRASSQRTHRLHRAVMACGRGETQAHSRGVRRHCGVPVGVDEQHGHGSHAAPYRAVASRVHGIGRQGAAHVRNRARDDDELWLLPRRNLRRRSARRRISLRHGHAGHASPVCSSHSCNGCCLRFP